MQQAHLTCLNGTPERQIEAPTLWRSSGELWRSAPRVRSSLGALQSLNEIFRRVWLRPPAVGLRFFLGIFTGSWGLTQGLSNSILSHIDSQALAVKIEEQRWAIKHQQRTTWGRRTRREADRATCRACRGLTAAVQRAHTASRTLGSGLQGDRRFVKRVLNRIRQIIRQRQRGPERDLGPGS